MLFKSYKHLTTTGQTDARRSHVIVLHTSGYIMFVCKYANFDQNIPCVLSIFTKRPQPAEMMLGEALSPLCIPVPGHVEINKYAEYYRNMLCGLKVMNIFIDSP